MHSSKRSLRLVCVSDEYEMNPVAPSSCAILVPCCSQHSHAVSKVNDLQARVVEKGGA